MRDENPPYVPNQIPPGQRRVYLGLSTLLIAYGSYGLWFDDIFVPGRRSSMHFHGAAAWCLYGAILCACLVMLSVVVDHYDRRDNEKSYRRFALIGQCLGGALLIAAIVWTLLDAP